MASAVLSPFESRQNKHSVRKYVKENRHLLECYVMMRYDQDAWDGAIADLTADEYVARTAIENFATTDAVKWRKIVETLAYSVDGASIAYILGQRGGGKTVLATDLAHAVMELTGRTVYAVGVKGRGPPWMKHSPDLKSIPEGAIAVYDEAGKQSGSRESMNKENRGTPGYLSTLRHNNVLLLVIAQNSQTADKSFITYVDHIIMKPFSLTQKSTERGSLLAQVAYWQEFHPRNMNELLWVSNTTNPWAIRRGIPDWYDRDWSFAHADLDEVGALAHAIQLYQGGFGPTEISRKLTAYGKRLTPQRWGQVLRKELGDEYREAEPRGRADAGAAEA